MIKTKNLVILFVVLAVLIGVSLTATVSMRSAEFLVQLQTWG